MAWLAGPLVLAHAFAGIIFFGGLIGRWVTLGAAARAEELRDVHAVLRVSAVFERMVIVGSMVVLVLGVAAAVAQERPFLGPLQGAGVDWLFVSLVLYLSLIPLVPVVFLPRGKTFEAALGAADAAGSMSPELRAAFHDPVVLAAHVYELGAVTVVLALMLTKPF